MRPALGMLADSRCRGVRGLPAGSGERMAASSRSQSPSVSPSRRSTPTRPPGRGGARTSSSAGEDIRQLLAMRRRPRTSTRTSSRRPEASTPFGSPADEVDEDEDAADEDAGEADPHMLAIAEVCGRRPPRLGSAPQGPAARGRAAPRWDARAAGRAAVRGPLACGGDRLRPARGGRLAALAHHRGRSPPSPRRGTRSCSRDHSGSGATDHRRTYAPFQRRSSA